MWVASLFSPASAKRTQFSPLPLTLLTLGRFVLTVPQGNRSQRYNVRVSFVIRDFQPEDFETLWRIDQDCFPPGISYTRPELKRYIRRRGSFTLVAADGGSGAIAGFLVGYEGSPGHIITIDVVRSVRRARVGSQLLGTAEARLRSGGAGAVELETAVDNLSALSFYRRHGYRVMRTWPCYYSNGVDALVLKKDLGPIR